MPIGNINNKILPQDRVVEKNARIKRYAIDDEGNEFEVRPVDEAGIILGAQQDMSIIKSQRVSILEANEVIEEHTASLRNRLERLQARQEPNQKVQTTIQDILNFLA